MSKKPAKPSQPKLEQVAELAMRLGGQHLAEYGSARSRQDFTQRQLMSCLILRAYLKTTYRGLLDVIEQRNYDVFSSRVRLSKWHKLGLALQALPVRWGWT